MSTDRHDVLRSDAVGYDPTRGTFHVDHDDAESPSICYTLLRAVAAVTGIEPEELEPLSESVDPDALDALFGSSARVGEDVTLTLRYSGCTLTVYSDGHVVVEPPE